MNIALITAGGTGTRMNNNIPKQFLNIEDKPLIIYTLEKFQTHPSIDAICVTCLKGWQEILKAYALAVQYYKIKMDRYRRSNWTGIHSQWFNDGCKKNVPKKDIIMIHDGNRAMVSHDIISDSLRICREKGSAVAAIPCTEAIFRCEDEDNQYSNISIQETRLFVHRHHILIRSKNYCGHMMKQKNRILKIQLLLVY